MKGSGVFLIAGCTNDMLASEQPTSGLEEGKLVLMASVITVALEFFILKR